MMESVVASPIFGLVFFGGTYAVLAVLLFAANLAAFEWITPFDVRRETFETQNEAVAHVVRGQLLGQGVMIASLIYFLGISYEHGISLWKLVESVAAILSYGLFGVFAYQSGWYVLSRFLPLEREIVAEANVALAKIIESLSVAFGLVLAVSLFSY